MTSGNHPSFTHTHELECQSFLIHLLPRDYILRTHLRIYREGLKNCSFSILSWEDLQVISYKIPSEKKVLGSKKLKGL